jgi:hypothetical protein
VRVLLGHSWAIIPSIDCIFLTFAASIRETNRNKPGKNLELKPMYLIPIAWIYVTFMMAVAEATNTNGTALGALVTFVFYGLLPVGLVLYFMAGPARRRARDAAEAREDQLKAHAAAVASAQASASDAPDTSGLAATDAVAPVRKEP